MNTQKTFKYVERLTNLFPLIEKIAYCGFLNIKISHPNVFIYIPFKEIPIAEKEISEYWVESHKQFKMFGYTVKFLPIETMYEHQTNI